jgi:hypothetical protein
MEDAGDTLPAGGFDALGHGLGFGGPSVTPDNDAELRAGMRIATEKLVARRRLGADSEHNVVTPAARRRSLSV